MKTYHRKFKKCLFAGCEKDCYGGGRGLCINHYTGWYGRVKRGSTTWEELEAKGLVERKMKQDEKNMNQMHPHRSYRDLEKSST